MRMDQMKTVCLERKSMSVTIKENRKGKAKASRIIAVLTAVSMALSALLAVMFDVTLVSVSYGISDKRITENIRLLVISDLHSCRFGENQSELICRIEEIEPDIILLTGDIIDNVRPQKDACELLEQIGTAYPCYYVTGNHEVWTGRVQELKELVAAFGVNVLDGRCETAEVRGCRINIAGIDDPALGDEDGQLASAFENADPECFTVLLAHRPERVDVYKQYPCDLLVNGHAHGGQWRLPPLCNGLYEPNQGFFPKYVGGRYDHEGCIQIVSRGVAMNYTVPRVFNPPELTVIELTP